MRDLFVNHFLESEQENIIQNQQEEKSVLFSGMTAEQIIEFLLTATEAEASAMLKSVSLSFLFHYCHIYTFKPKVHSKPVSFRLFRF